MRAFRAWYAYEKAIDDLGLDQLDSDLITRWGPFLHPVTEPVVRALLRDKKSVVVFAARAGFYPGPVVNDDGSLPREDELVRLQLSWGTEGQLLRVLIDESVAPFAGDPTWKKEPLRTNGPLGPHGVIHLEWNPDNEPQLAYIFVGKNGKQEPTKKELDEGPFLNRLHP